MACTKRGFAELVGLLEQEQGAYTLLLSLSKGQKQAFQEGGGRGLMKIIARKQGVIERIRLIDERLGPYTSSWEETTSALPAPARREVGVLVAEISALVHEIVMSERAMEKALAAGRDEVSRQMKSVTGGLAATKAYAKAGPSAQKLAAGAGRIIDREG